VFPRWLLSGKWVRVQSHLTRSSIEDPGKISKVSLGEEKPSQARKGLLFLVREAPWLRGGDLARSGGAVHP
jgi:hypothetical protein